MLIFAVRKQQGRGTTEPRPFFNTLGVYVIHADTKNEMDKKITKSSGICLVFVLLYLIGKAIYNNWFALM